MNYIFIMIIAFILFCFVCTKENVIEIVQHKTKPSHLSILINGQKFDFDKFGAHVSDYRADRNDLIDKPMDCNSMAFLEAKNEPMLVFDELIFKWLAFAEADNVAKTTTTTTSSSSGTIRTVDFVIDFVMKVANVGTFLWPKLLYGIDELRNQYNSSGSDRQVPSLSFSYDQSTRKVWLSKGIIWLDIDPLSASAHYYAFGGGPRICIGMRFALLEEKMALVRLLGRYSLAKTEQTEKLLKVNAQVVFNPGAVMVQLNLREENI